VTVTASAPRSAPPRRALVVVGKAPIPGQVKTRLCPPLTPALAAGLHAAFLRDTLALAAAVPAVESMVLYPPVPGAVEMLRATLGPAARLLPQRGVGLGAALAGAVAMVLSDGFDQVALLSSDNPNLPPAPIAAGFAALDAHDVALGPAADGGYYLIALKAPHLGVFEGITWSTAVVLAETCARARDLSLRLATLPAWHDVDDVAGLRRLDEELRTGVGGAATHTRAYLAEHFPSGLPT
jgi:rSAM/selenodomain-associated transferase 1